MSMKAIHTKERFLALYIHVSLTSPGLAAKGLAVCELAPRVLL